MPGHPAMAALGKTDSIEESLTYMDAVIGDVGPASSSSAGAHSSRPCRMC